MGFLIKEIKSKKGELHFKRWRIIETKWFSIYVHAIYKADEDKHKHDHPWNYTSIVLKGRLQEKVKGNWITEGGINYFPGDVVWKRKAEEFHQISEVGGPRMTIGRKDYAPPTITLFLTGRRRREWGYDVNGEWFDHIIYRLFKNIRSIMRKKKSESEKVYNRLKKMGYTDEEIAESFIFPSDEVITEEQQEEFRKALAEFRKKSRENMTDEERNELNEFIDRIKKEG